MLLQHDDSTINIVLVLLLLLLLGLRVSLIHFTASSILAKHFHFVGKNPKFLPDKLTQKDECDDDECSND